MSDQKPTLPIPFLNLAMRLGRCLHFEGVLRMSEGDPKMQRECLIKIGAEAEQISRDVQEAVRGF